jgi:hypothetical protein
MPIMSRSPQAYQEPVASSVTQLTADASGVARYGPFFSGPYSRVRISIDRHTSVGAQTMAVGLEILDETTGDIYDWDDHAGAALTFVTFADDSHIRKELEVGIGVLSSDADDTLVFDTNYKAFNQALPSAWYIKVTGASGTSDTYSITIHWQP